MFPYTVLLILEEENCTIMATLPINLLLVLTASAFVEGAILVKVDQADLDAVRIGLEEEKTKRLLLQNDLEDLMLQVEELRRGNSQILKDNMAVFGFTTCKTPRIAFTATLSKPITHVPGQTVIFDTVKVNEGNCYNSTTGRFRARYRGLYSFSVTVLKQTSTDVHLYVVKDNEEIGRVYSGTGSYGSGSVTVVTLMDIGQMVYLKQSPYFTETIHGDFWGTFTGLLQA